MSEEYEVVEELLKDAEEKKAELLDAQQRFNQGHVNQVKAGLQDRIDKFVGIQASAGGKAAEALQRKIDSLQSSYDYWDGPEPANERAKLGPQISEVTQLINQLRSLLGTLPPPPPPE